MPKNDDIPDPLRREVYARIDTIHAQANYLIYKNRLPELDDFVLDACMSIDVDVVLSWLVASSPVKTKLPHRPALYRHFCGLVKNAPDMIQGLA